MTVYGQYCPLALAAEVLCERWNLLILRRLLDGCERFNEIHQGVPRISATLLSSRLGALEKAGLLSKERNSAGRGHRYFLTPAGQALLPITESMAAWGQEWSRDMTSDDMDPVFLMYSMRQRINVHMMPPGRTVICFRFTGAPAHCRGFWLIHSEAVDMCLKDPGHPVDLYVHSDLALFIESWRGIRNLREELRRGSIKLDGPTVLVRAFPSWLQLSAYAGIRRCSAGRERKLQE
ncbi:MAG: helix-turn-helix domain-containing protein [Pseudomonadota bacterium]